MSDYKAAKEVVLQCARDLMDSAPVKGNQFAADLIKASAERLKDDSFTLVVLGEFKRGKSTLVNAILGTPVMPSALVPLTAIPTLVKYGEKAAGRVLFQNGSAAAIAAADVEQYVAEKYNPANVKNVREVTIDYPAARLREGMVLVDTPGVGSAYQHNTDSAYGYLPYADSAVFLISVDAPLSRTELDYLQDIRGHVRKIFFVLNKTDMVDPGEIDEVLAFTRKVLQENLDAPDVYLLPVSARLALAAKQEGDAAKLRASRLDILERDLEAFARGGSRGALILTAAVGRLLKVVEDGETAENLWRRAMDDTLEGLEDKIGRFDRALTELEQEREDSIYLLYREIDRVAAGITERMQVYHRENLPVLLKRLHEYARGDLAGQSPRQTAAALHKYVIDLVQTALERKKDKEWENIQDEVSALAERFFERIGSIVERLLQTAAQIFDVDVVSTARKDYVTGERRIFFHFHEHPSFIPNLTDLPVFSLIPASLARGMVEKKAVEKLAELMDRNCGRVRYNLTEKLRESTRETAGDLRLRADALGRGLKQSLEDAVAQRGCDQKKRTEIMAVRKRQMDFLVERRRLLEKVLLEWEGRVNG